MPYRTIQSYINEAIANDGWEMILIWGEQGKGKSTLAMQLMYDVYGDWDIVLGHNVYKYDVFDDVVDEDAGKYGRCKIVNWDDLGVHFSARTKRWDRDVQEFLDEFDAIRTRLAVLVGTVVQLSEPMKGLRNIATCEIKTMQRGFATFHKLIWMTHFKRAGEMFVHKRMEFCPVWGPLPNPIFERYKQQRELMVKEKHAARRELVVTRAKIKKVIERMDGDDTTLLLGIYNRSMEGYFDHISYTSAYHILKSAGLNRTPEEIENAVVRLSALKTVTFHMGKIRLQPLGRKLAEHIIAAEGLKLRPLEH